MSKEVSSQKELEKAINSGETEIITFDKYVVTTLNIKGCQSC